MAIPPHLPQAALELLDRYPLSPPPWPWHVPAPEPPGSLRDRFRGSLLWGAVGDALGRPTEGRSWHRIRERWGHEGVSDFQPWRGWQDGPIGTWTDDTQLTIEVARTILESRGWVDPARLAERLRAWLLFGRGKGKATTLAVNAMEAGDPWWEAGLAVDSAGNGAAMRAAPVGLAWALVPATDMLVREAVLSALPTHTHPVGVAGAVAIAVGVAACIRLADHPIDPQDFLSFVAASIDGIEPGPTPLRSDPSVAVTLRDRILGVGDLLAVEPGEVFRERLWSGAFALESVPAALYCFLRSAEDPARAIRTAANAGHDTDTIASMTGHLVGARQGAKRLQDEAPGWWDELEGREGLAELADSLLAVALDHGGVSTA